MPRTFLIATMPLVGHTNPVKPIARALVEQGHHVRWYATHRSRAAVEATGAQYVPMDPALDPPQESAHRQLPGREGLTGLAALRFDFKHGFLDPAPTQVDELRRLAAEETVDAVIADQGFLGAGLFHELTGVPWVSVGVSPLTIASRDTAPFGLALPPSATPLGRLRNRALNAALQNVLLRDVAAHHRMIRARVGLPPQRVALLDAISPLLHLQSGIAELEYPRSDLPAQVHFVGNLADKPAAAPQLPSWWADVVEATVPVVHVTQGTVADGDVTALVRPTVEALADEPVLVVAGTGRGDLGALGKPPANVRTAPFVPHGWLLPQTAVLVTNAGFGAVQTALANGVPMVAAGATEDKPEVAARLARAGAGIDLKTGRPSAEQIRTAVRRLLDDGRYAKRAGELGEVYRRRDAGDLSAELVESLVDQRRPVARR
jgi:MGT family glycosyltransferase